MTSGLRSRLIHTCTIKRKTATGTDELGQPINTETTQSGVACRFTSLNTNVAQGFTGQGESGRFILKIPLVFFAAGADIKEGDFITTTAAGWTNKTYEVSNVDKITDFNSSTIDHIEAQLKSLEKGA